MINIISKYPLLKLGFKYVIKNNKSNLAPYHNLNHMLCVVKYCYNALEFMGILDDENTESLLLAALFHDFNHSMGRRDDSFNITQAKLGVIDFYETNNVLINLPFINEIIDATQYPYIIDNKYLSSDYS